MALEPFVLAARIYAGFSTRGKLARLAARTGTQLLLRGVAYTVSDSVIPPVGKITEKRRIGVTHFGKDQVTRIRAARIGRRSNAGRKVDRRSSR